MGSLFVWRQLFFIQLNRVYPWTKGVRLLVANALK